MRSNHQKNVERWINDISVEDERNLLQSFDSELGMILNGHGEEALLMKGIVEDLNIGQVHRAALFRGRDYRFLGALTDQKLQTEGIGLLMHTYARVKLGLNMALAVEASRQLIRLQDMHDRLKRMYGHYPELMKNLEKVIANANEEAISTPQEAIQMFQAHVREAYRSRLQR